MAALNPDPEPPPLWALRTEIPTFVADHCEDACDLAVWRAIRWLISRADRELLGIDARTIASHAKIDVKTALRSIHGDRSSSKAKRQPRRPKRGLVGLGLLEIAEYQSVGKINPRPVYRIPSWIEDQNTRYICEMLTRQGVTPQPPAPPPKQAPPPPAPPPKQAPPPATPDLHVAPPPPTPDLHVAPPPPTPDPYTGQEEKEVRFSGLYINHPDDWIPRVATLDAQTAREIMACWTEENTDGTPDPVTDYLRKIVEQSQADPHTDQAKDETPPQRSLEPHVAQETPPQVPPDPYTGREEKEVRFSGLYINHPDDW
ncbi:MAG: hypothetical protein WCJ55_14455, partial [Chloroflexales bacterium]